MATAMAITYGATAADAALVTDILLSRYIDRLNGNGVVKSLKNQLVAHGAAAGWASPVLKGFAITAGYASLITDFLASIADAGTAADVELVTDVVTATNVTYEAAHASFYTGHTAIEVWTTNASPGLNAAIDTAIAGLTITGSSAGSVTLTTAPNAGEAGQAFEYILSN